MVLFNKAFDDSELSEDEKFLKLLNHAILENIDNYKFGVSELAHAVNLSERQLYRNVQSLTGHTPAGLIREMRLQRAHKLVLKQQVKTKKELANRVGYKSTSHFINTYQERFEECPDILAQNFGNI